MIQSRASLCIAVWFGLASVATAACEQKREGKFESTAAKTAPKTEELGLDVQIVPDRDLFQPWSMAKVKIKIKNRSRTPVILQQLSLKTSGGTAVFNESDLQKQPAIVGPDELRIEGTYFVDEVGAQARRPGRSYWRWSGKDELTVFTLLMPLQERSWKGRFRARYEVGDEFRAVVKYIPVPDDFRYFRKVKIQRTRLRKPVRQGKMVGRWKHTVHFAKATTAPGQPGTALEAPADPGRRAKKNKRRKKQARALETWAAPSSYLDSLPSKTSTSTKPLGLRRFAFDIGTARAKAKIAKGPYTRAVDAGVWVLFGKGKSWVVSRDEVIPVEGNALPFANRLNAGRRQPVFLFRAAPSKDHDGLVSFFKRERFRVKARREKDGTFTGVLELESAKFVSFLKLLARRKLRVDGVDAVAPI